MERLEQVEADLVQEEAAHLGAVADDGGVPDALLDVRLELARRRSVACEPCWRAWRWSRGAVPLVGRPHTLPGGEQPLHPRVPRLEDDAPTDGLRYEPRWVVGERGVGQAQMAVGARATIRRRACPAARGELLGFRREGGAGSAVVALPRVHGHEVRDDAEDNDRVEWLGVDRRPCRRRALVGRVGEYDRRAIPAHARRVASVSRVEWARWDECPVDDAAGAHKVLELRADARDAAGKGGRPRRSALVVVPLVEPLERRERVVEALCRVEVALAHRRHHAGRPSRRRHCSIGGIRRLRDRDDRAVDVGLGEELRVAVVARLSAQARRNFAERGRHDAVGAIAEERRLHSVGLSQLSVAPKERRAQRAPPVGGTASRGVEHRYSACRGDVAGKRHGGAAADAKRDAHGARRRRLHAQPLKRRRGDVVHDGVVDLAQREPRGRRVAERGRRERHRDWRHDDAHRRRRQRSWRAH